MDDKIKLEDLGYGDFFESNRGTDALPVARTLAEHKEVAELLIAKGADIHARRGYPAGDTPLHSAARKGHKDIVDLLINKGADVNTKNGQGETPLDVVGSRNRKDIIELLKKHGATEEPPQAMRERFQRMSPEEREKMRERMRKRLEDNKKHGAKE